MPAQHPRNRYASHAIDEWGGGWRQWSEYEQADAIQALQTISEEGRKFTVNVTVILHKLTKQDTGIDEGLSGAADLYLMGDAISQTTWTFPASLRSQRDQLLKDRRAQLAAVEVAQRVMIYRDPITGDARIVVAPDLSQPQQIDLQTGLTTEAVEAAYQPGMSLDSHPVQPPGDAAVEGRCLPGPGRWSA